MKIPISLNGSRREFISRVIPGCALMYLGCGGTISTIQESKNDAKEPPEKKPKEEAPIKHKFENEMERNFTPKQLYSLVYREYIGLTKVLAEQMGREELIKFLEDYSTKKMMDIGKQQAIKLGKDDFQSYVDQFAASDAYKETLTKEVIEHTETVLELKVTECIWAKTFLDAQAGDIGYASVCYGDYAWARGFNPKINLVRDKTLMQGDAYCNHRYIWEG